MQERLDTPTPLEVNVLSAARDILEGIGEAAAANFWRCTAEVDGTPFAHDYGRLAEAASRAEEAIFHVLNVATSYCGVSLSYEELHNHPEANAEAASEGEEGEGSDA